MEDCVINKNDGLNPWTTQATTVKADDNGKRRYTQFRAEDYELQQGKIIVEQKHSYTYCYTFC